MTNYASQEQLKALVEAARKKRISEAQIETMVRNYGGIMENGEVVKGATPPEIQERKGHGTNNKNAPGHRIINKF